MPFLFTVQHPIFLSFSIFTSSELVSN
jgi:hypothetical protein